MSSTCTSSACAARSTTDTRGNSFTRAGAPAIPSRHTNQTARMIESIRARLTVWYVSVLAVVLVAVSVTIYGLLARALYSRIDVNLRVVNGIAVTSLANDLAEGQDALSAARSTTAELFSGEVLLAIYDGDG